MKTCKKGHHYEPTKKYRGNCPECGKQHTAHKRKTDPKDKRQGEKLLKYWPGSDWQEALNNRNQMFVEQNGNCAVCGRNQSALKRQLMVDHDHKTGRVRALLCQFCNTAEGFLGTPEVAEALVKYMRAN